MVVEPSSHVFTRDKLMRMTCPRHINAFELAHAVEFSRGISINAKPRVGSAGVSGGSKLSSSDSKPCRKRLVCCQGGLLAVFEVMQPRKRILDVPSSITAAAQGPPGRIFFAGWTLPVAHYMLCYVISFEVV